MAGSTSTPFQLVHILTTTKLMGYPIAKFYPGVSGLSNLLVCSQGVQYFGPVPFRRVDTTYIFGIIRSIPLLGKLGYFFRFLHRRVIFPEDKHGVGVLSKLIVQCQRSRSEERRVGEGGGASRA